MDCCEHCQRVRVVSTVSTVSLVVTVVSTTRAIRSMDSVVPQDFVTRTGAAPAVKYVRLDLSLSLSLSLSFSISLSVHMSIARYLLTVDYLSTKQVVEIHLSANHHSMTPLILTNQLLMRLTFASPRYLHSQALAALDRLITA